MMATAAIYYLFIFKFKTPFLSNHSIYCIKLWQDDALTHSEHHWHMKM